MVAVQKGNVPRYTLKTMSCVMT